MKLISKYVLTRIYKSKNATKQSTLFTDDFIGYKRAHKLVERHDTVNHSAMEYARGDVSTNTIEGFFGLLKRGIDGSFHHVSSKHLQRYCDEFSFRYNYRKTDDGDRTTKALAQAEGLRLMYKEPLRKAG